MGDMVEKIEAAKRALARAEDNAGSLPARESVKLRPNDWHQLASAIRALSQGEQG